MRGLPIFVKGMLGLAVLTAQTVAFAAPPITYRAVIVVKDGSNTSLGYAAVDPNYWTPLLTPDKTAALIVDFTLSGTSGTQINLTPENSNQGPFPYFGAVQGRDSTSDNIAAGSFNYLYLGNVNATAPGATPQHNGNYFSRTAGLDKASESAIWTIDVNALTIAPVWINTDASSPTTVTFVQSNHLYAGGDADAFHSRFPAPVTTATLHLEILTQSQGPFLSVNKTHVGTFVPGATGEWDITVSNATGSTATSGTTTVSDTLPSGFTINSFSTTDASWICSGATTATATCTSTAAITGGANFPVIKVIVNIPAAATGSVMNTANAYGGGDTTHSSLATAASGSDTVALAQLPSSITPTAGTPQSTRVNTAFPTNLQVTVRDRTMVAVPNVSVTFQAPNSGPSGTFAAPCSGTTCVVTTNAMGVATAPTFTANGTVGSYVVTATVSPLSPVNFQLSNVGTPTFTKTIATPFGPDINLGDTTAVTFTISNPNGIALTGLSFTDPLPSGLLIQNPNALANTCGGTVTAAPGTGTIILANGTVAASSSCTITVNVTGAAQGPQTNPAITLTSNEAPSAIAAAVGVYVDWWWLAFFY
jgi:uncharacterized repeat protein (TIGR01451 family)